MFQVSGGVRLGTGAVNINNLPQTYQSGLGTNDILLGVSYTVDEITLAAAYQLTTGRSANMVTRLQRGDDLMVRVSYTKPFEQLTAGGRNHCNQTHSGIQYPANLATRNIR